MKIIWCMVPEIWSTRDINFCQFGHFFCSFTPLLTEKIKILKKLKNTGDIIILHVYHKWQSYDVWYLRYGMRRTNFFDSWGGILCSFPSLATRKIKILKKWKKKKTHGDIILLHQCIKNHDHIYAIPEIWHVTDVIFLFFTLDYFLPWRAEK